MLKIKHKELAILLGVSKAYSRTLLNRKGLRLSNKYLNEIMALVVKYQNKQEKNRAK
jgi:hypothetical protein